MGQWAAALIAMGMGSIVLAAALRSIVRWPPVPLNPRATPEQVGEAQRYRREIDTIIVPWVYRLGAAAAVVGVVLGLVAVIR